MKFKIKYLLIGIVTISICILFGREFTNLCHKETNDFYAKNAILAENESFNLFRYQSYITDIEQECCLAKNKTMPNILSFRLENETDIFKEISFNIMQIVAQNDTEVIYPYWWHFTYGAT